MDLFIGRKSELEKLNELYSKNVFQFPVIYGRRRVGKTALINEFIKDKEAIFFTGIESNAKQNLENLSKSILSYAGGLLDSTVFPSFQAALEYVFKLAETKRIVFVIDEYPYVAKVSKSLASTLQMLIDRNKGNSKLFLLLCGSSMSFMENHVLAYKAPLYGRRTAQFKILPFNFFECKSFFLNASNLDAAIYYGIVGGTPQYLMQIDDELTVEENIKQCFLVPSSPLFEEPGNLLKQEVRECAAYNAIISAIATGSTKLSEISSKVGEGTSVCAAYVKNLISLGIIKKEKPFLSKSTRKSIYKIDDNLFRFWHRFIPGNIAAINRGFIDAAYKTIVENINAYMGVVFEDICITYLWKLRAKGDSALDFTDIGRWWGSDPVKKSEAEIDIMGTDGKNSALYCECKWTNENIDTGVLSALVDRSRLFQYEKTGYYLFAKNGFTIGCKEKAANLGNVSLVAFEEMAKAFT